MGGVYEFSKQASANLRQKDDAYNTAIGGFLAGAVMALRSKGIHSSAVADTAVPRIT